MKKLMFTTILALTMIIFTACNAEEDTGELAARHFHADLDYMLHTLENNFALFDVAYWARGVDIYAIVDDIRAEIDVNPDMDVDGFYDALTRNFEPLQWIAHFEIVSPRRHYFFMNDPAGRRLLGSFAPSSFARLRESHVMAFYEDRWARPQAAAPQGVDETIAHLMNINDIEIEAYIERFNEVLTSFGQLQLAAELATSLRARDFEEATRLFEIIDDIFTNISEGTNITTSILEEGRVAFLAVNSFIFEDNRRASDVAKTLAFYQDIAGFDHLIVDLRSSGGGNHRYFLDAIISPNIDELIVLDAFYFFIAGDYVVEFISPRGFQGASPAGTPVRTLEADLGKMPMYQILEEFYLPQFNTADAERLQYGIQTQIRIQSARDTNTSFDGRIWVLTGLRMGSASQIAAWAAKESEVATLVGNITGGVYGGPRTMVALPNSGILFLMDVFYVADEHGRPLEAGTIPHYFNIPGMDALETVLAMIEEGY